VNIKADNFTLLRQGNYFVTPVQLALGVQVFLCNVSLATSQGRTAGATAQCTLSQAFAWSAFAILSLHETEDINDNSYLMDTNISALQNRINKNCSAFSGFFYQKIKKKTKKFTPDGTV
jgi:hypothetical protein